MSDNAYPKPMQTLVKNQEVVWLITGKLSPQFYKFEQRRKARRGVK